MLVSRCDGHAQTEPVKTLVIEELKTFMRTEQEARQGKKTLVAMIYQDHGYEAITGLLDVSLRASNKWKQAYEQDFALNDPSHSPTEDAWLQAKIWLRGCLKSWRESAFILRKWVNMAQTSRLLR